MITSFIKKHVLVVIPVHNRIEDLKLLLSGLSGIYKNNVEVSIAIVDDGSASDVREEIENKFKGTTFNFFHNKMPRGPAFSRNLAASAIKSDYIWFLDSDIEIPYPQILENMIARLNINNNIGAIGGVMEEHNGEWKLMELDILKNFIFQNRSFIPPEYKPSYVDGIPTSNLFLKRENYERVGGFREDLKRDEDNDLCLALREQGYHLYQDKSTVLWHKLSNSGRKSGAFAHFADPRLYLKDLLQTRIVLLVRHAPRRIIILPILDMILAPIIFYRIRAGKYTINRFKKAIPKSHINWLGFFIAEYVRNYCFGLKLLLHKLVK